MSSTFPIPLSYITFILVLFSFFLTILNLLALYTNSLTTLRYAPQEIRDGLGNLRAQILEEREALRQQSRELHNKKAHLRGGDSNSNNNTRRGGGGGGGSRTPQQQHPAHRGRPRSAGRSLDNLHATAAAYTLTHSEQTLDLHYQMVRDLWRRFKTLERPFLISDGGDRSMEMVHQQQQQQQQQHHHHHNVMAPWGGANDLGVAMSEKKGDIERHGEAGSSAADSYYNTPLYHCDFIHRIIWWQSKQDVLKLAELVQRVMMRRMEREVTCTRMMVKQLRDGGDGPEDIVGSRKFDCGGGGGRSMTTAGRRSASRGTSNTSWGTGRLPIGETYNVYESTDSSDSGANNNNTSKTKRRPDERDSRIQVSEIRPNGPNRVSSGGGPTQKGDIYDTQHAEAMRKQGQYKRLFEMPSQQPSPTGLRAPGPARPRTRQVYDDITSPYA